ncbi:MAG: hypothetical protein WDA09_02670 [Bacteriovoracaceae bacterium]
MSYADSSVACISSGESNSYGIFLKDEVHKLNFPPLKDEIVSLEGGSCLLCALLSNGQRYCLGNNTSGGMTHDGVEQPLLLNPVSLHP